MQPDTRERIVDALRRQAHDEAVDAAREATDAAPGDAQSHRLLAMALRASGEHDAARASIEQAIALSPDDADLHFDRAGYLLGTRQVAEVPPSHVLGAAHFPPGHWRAYAQPLGDAFALLTSVARRLGYPEH